MRPRRLPLFFLANVFINGAVLFASSAAAADEEAPNILVILADDLGYGDLSCYGGEDLRTPHLDALAAEGMRFTNFYANCPVCSPRARPC